jgi:hypothetical protein
MLTESLTGRQRLLATLQRQPVDRVPISTYELSAFGPLAWATKEPSYQRLLQEITMHTEALPLWAPGQLPTPEEASWKSVSWTEGDFTLTRLTMQTPKGELTTVTKYTPNVKTVWTTEHLCKTREDINRYLSLPFHPRPVDVSAFAPLNAAVGDRGLVICDTGDAICNVADLFEFGDFTVLAMTEPEIIRALCDRAHERVMHVLREALAAGCGPLFRICGAEYCTPPFLPPSAFREFVVPYVTEMVALIHRYGGYARLHCHGRIAQVLDMIMTTGVDALDPLEPPPDGDISLAEVKDRVGDQLLLFGNMELKYLETETPQEINVRVRDMMAAAKSGGGYILMPTAAPINIPLSPRTEANYLAFIAAGYQYGQYD